jgi:DNA-binding MarR family transcriptional regulator
MDNLERRDFIVRRRNPDDRRKINIFLTSKGMALKGQLIGYADEVNRIALAGLSPGDVGKLRRYLHAINRSLGTSFEATATGHGTGKGKPKTARKASSRKAAG